MDLDEVTDEGTGRLAGSSVGRDKGDEDEDAVPREQIRDEGNPRDVRIAILARETEAPGEVGPDHIAIEELDARRPSATAEPT